MDFVEKNYVSLTVVNAEAGGIICSDSIKRMDIVIRLDLGQSTWEWKAGLSGRQLYSGEILI